MNRFLGKLGFIHRRLWRQDGLYRTALLLGPAPLIGLSLAGILWAGVQALERTTYRPPQWATPQGTPAYNAGNAQPRTIEPPRPLPSPKPDGMFAGYEAGWRVTTHSIEVSPTLDVDLKPTPLAGVSLDGLTVDMGQIMAGGPKTPLYVAVGTGFLAIRTAGTYSLSVRFERPAGPRANCLIRLGFGPGRVVSALQVATVNDLSKTFDPAQFDLREGLYPINWAFGCWHDQEVIGPGRITILVGHPGEQSILPARPDEIVRLEQIKR